jgi:hypothetical protein
MGALQIGNWKDKEWLLERIIQYYGLAPWAEDRSWCYCTLVYMLNRIIRLKAVVEIITNKTAIALNLLSKQQENVQFYLSKPVDIRPFSCF